MINLSILYNLNYIYKHVVLLLILLISLRFSSISQITTVSISDTTICLSTAVQLNTVPSGGTNYTYSWTPSASLSASNISNPVATPSTTTSYIVTITDVPTLQIVSDTITIFVQNVPPPLAIFPDNDTICLGDTLLLEVLNSSQCAAEPKGSCQTALSVNTSGTGTLLAFTEITNPFYKENNFLTQRRSTKHQYVFTVKELNDIGVFGPTSIKGISWDLIANINTFTYNNLTFKMGCTNDSVLGTNFIAGLTTVYNPKTAAFSISQWEYFNFDQSFVWDGKSNIILEVCFSNPSAITGMAFVRYNNYSRNVANYISANIDVCSAISGQITQSRPNTRFHTCDVVHTGSLTYNWTPATGLSNSSIRNPFAFPTVNTDYIVSFTDINGCTGEDTVSITVAPDFTATINNDTTLCHEDTLDLNSFTTGGPGVTYKWSSSAWIENDILQNTRAYFNEPVQVEFLAVSAAGCEKRKNMFVNFVLPVSIEILTEDTTVCQGESIPLEISSNRGGCGTIPPFACPDPDNTVLPGTSIFPAGGVVVSPFDGNALFPTPGQRKQFIITAAELSAISSNEAITSLGFNILSLSTTNTLRDNFTVRMTCTGLSSFNFGNQSFQTGLQTVYASKPYNISTGWNDIVFDNPFFWDGVSNVLVEICWQNTSTIGLVTSSMNYSVLPSPMTILAWNSTDVCNEEIAFSTTIRPEMRFGYCTNPPNPFYTYLWTPASTVSNPSIPEPFTANTVTSYLNLLVVDPLTGCFDKDSVLVEVAPDFTTNVTADTVLCLSDTINLEVTHTSLTPVTYKWTPSSQVIPSNSPNPQINVNSKKVVVSEVRSSLGCIKWDTINLGLQDPINLILTMAPGPFCEGDTAGIEAFHVLQCGISNLDKCVPTDSAVFGTSTSTSNSNHITPFVNALTGSKRQYLFRKAELQAAGMNGPSQISSLAFFITSLGKSDFQNFTIKMRCINVSSLNSTFRTSMQTVFNPKDINLNNGKNVFEFDSRYNWDGESNLLVEICYSNNLAGAPSEVSYSNTSFNSVTYAVGSGACTFSSGPIVNSRPNMEFKFCQVPTLSYIYNWSPASNFNDPSLKNPIVTLDTSGFVKLILTDMNSGCELSDSLKADVHYFEVEALYDTTLCNTEDFQLDVVTNAFNPLYNWQPAVELSNNTIKNPKILIENGMAYIVEVTDSSGCKNSDTVNIVLLPKPSASASPNSVDVCRFDQILLSGSGGITYSWSPSTGLSSPGSSTTLATVQDSTVYYLTVTNVEGCTDIDSVIVNIFPSPLLNLGPDTNYCNGGFIRLNAGSDFLSYRWQDNSQDSLFLVDSDGKYWVSVTDNFNCSFSDTVNVGIAPSPVTNIKYHTDICEGDSAILDALNPGSKFIWSTGETGQQIIVKDSGYYFVEIDNGRCIGKDSTIVAIYKYPVSPLEDIEYYCEKELPFGYTLLAGGEEYRYKWGNGQVTNSIVVTSEGTYNVIITSGGKCSIEKFVEVKHLCSERIFVPNSFTPNNDWNNDFFSISALNTDEFEFRIFNRWGEIIYYTSDPEFEWDGNLNGRPLPEGVYVWRIDYKMKLADGSYEKREEKGSLTLIR